MYECPSCGAGLEFNPKTQKLKCNYCGNEYTQEEFEKMSLKTAKGEKDIKQEGNEQYDAILYRCSQCGSELITTDETIATFCNYCGSSAVLERKDVKKDKPNYIIPFTKTKEECEEIYKEKIKKAHFAPKDMLDEQQIEKIRGIYMPYWIYSYKKEGLISAKGKKYKCRRGDYIYYNDYDITTNIKAKYSGMSHDASSNFSDNLSEAIAPFKISEKKDFNPAYLSGFYADAEDVKKDIYKNDFQKVAGNQAAKELRKDTVYSSYSSDPKVDMDLEKVELGLFPVYFLATKNKKGDRISYSIINGQTGKIAADIPIDFKKYIFSSLVLAIPIFILLTMLFTITPLKVNVISAIFSFFSTIIVISQHKKIQKRENKQDDKGYVSTKENNQNNNKTNIQIFKPIIALIITIALFILKPVSDVYYYSGAVLSILMIIWSFSDIIKGLNLLATRKLPQLEKRGGDENA